MDSFVWAGAGQNLLCGLFLQKRSGGYSQIIHVTFVTQNLAICLYNECKIWLMNTGQQQQKIFLRIPMKAILKSLKIIASHWAPLMIPLAKIRGDIYLMISWYVPVCHCIDDWIQCGVKVACRYHMMNHNHICKTDKIFIYM